MNKHIQPTADSIAEEKEKIDAELEVLSKEHEAGGVEEEPGDAIVNPELKEEKEPKEDPKEKETEDEIEDEEDEPKVKELEKEVEEDPKEKPKQDIKKRYKESTREAQVLHAKNKKLNEAFKKVSSVVDPTLEEMQEKYSDWEDMTDFEKKMATNDLKNERKFKAIDSISAETEDSEKWNTKVDKFIDDPQALIDEPRLEGKVGAFKDFASKSSRRSIEMPDLVDLFLYNVDKDKPAKKKGQMFEKGSGGDSKKHKPKSDKLSLEQGISLKKSNYNEYVRQLKAGKIESGF